VEKSIKVTSFKSNVIKVPRFKEDSGFVASANSSATMKKIKSKNSKVEVAVRKVLWARGFRYRLHAKGIKGRPDFVFTKQKLVVFIDGDFWHGYNWPSKKPKLISNQGYWIPKIERNMQRDKEVTEYLINAGWVVIRIWEHEVKEDLHSCINKIAAAILLSGL
jgi:DNA mismatch endonuclease (patch repair protein)